MPPASWLCCDLHVLRWPAPILNAPAVQLTRLGVIIVFLALIGYFSAVLLPRSLTKRRAPPIDYAESLGEHGVASTRRG